MASVFNWERILAEERHRQELERKAKEEEKKKEEPKKDLRTRTVEMNRRRAEEDDTYAPARVSREAYDALRDGSYTSAQSAPKKKNSFAEDVEERRRAYESKPKIKTLFGTKPAATVLEQIKQMSDPSTPVDPNTPIHYDTVERMSQRRLAELSNQILKAESNPALDLSYTPAQRQADLARLTKEYREEEAFLNQIKKERRESNTYENIANNDRNFGMYASRGSNQRNPNYNDTFGKPVVFGKQYGTDPVKNKVEYAFESKDYLLPDETYAARTLPGTDAKYLMMTDKERATYNYFLGKGYETTAEDYLNSIDNELTARLGEVLAKRVAQDNNSFRKAANTINYSTGAGMESGIYGIGSAINRAVALNDEPYTQSYMQQTYNQLRPQVDGALGVAADISNSIGNMIPAVAAGTFAGPAAGAAVMGLSTGGNAYADARREGKSDEEAGRYALLEGGKEALMSYLLSGIGSLGKAGASATLSKIPALNKAAQTVGKVADKLKVNPKVRAAFRASGKYLANMGDEGLEEYIQEVLEPVIRNVAFDENNEMNLFSEEALYAGALGAITAGVFNAAEIPQNYNRYKNQAAERIQQRTDAAAQNVQPKNADKNKDLIRTNPADTGPVPTAPESSSSLDLTIPQTLPDVNSTEYTETAGQKVNENPSPNIQNESDMATSKNRILEIVENLDRTADLEQARSVIDDYAKRGGLDVRWYSDQSRPDRADANGFYENGAIYINENAENPYMEVFKHELFHALSDSDKRAVTDFFRKNVNENTQAFQDYKMRTMQANRRKNLRYSDTDFWEEYTAQNAEFLLDEAWIERLAQTDKNLAQRILDWIRRAVQRIGDLFSTPKDYSAEVASHESGRVSGLTDDQLRKAQRLYERALNGTREAGSGTRYSIETLPDGKRYVQADRQVITGNDPKQWAKQVEQYINDEIRQGKDVTVYGADGDPLTITRDTAGKARFRNYITYPDGSKRRMNNQEYGVKLRAESHIDEVSAVSNRGNKTVPDTKNHDFAKDGFNYRTAYYRDTDGTYYRLTISVGKNGDINSVYNIGKLKEAPFPDVAQRPDSNAAKGEAPNTNIPQSGTGVNTSIRESVQNDTTKNSLKRSKFYDSIQQADTVADEVKQRAQDAEADYYYRQIGNDETMQKAVAEVGGNRETAGRKFLATKDDAATTDDIAKGFVLLRQYQDAGDYDAAVDVAKKLAKVGTEKGRQVQIYSILGRLTPEGMLRYSASELERVKNTLGNSDKGRLWLKKHEKQLDLTSEEAKQISDRMERVQVMPDGRDKAVILAEIQKLLQSKMPTSLGSKLSTLQRVSLLLNPKTVISRNALSNMLMNPIYATSDFIASGVDKAIGKKTGLRTIAAPNYKEQAKGWKKGAFESYDDFRRAINTRDIQANRYEIGNKLDSGPAFKGKNPLSKAVAFLDRTTGFLLDVGDRPFFEGYFLESLNGQMRTNKTDMPTPDMIDIATQTALEKTWQDDNAVTRSASKIKSALNFGRDFGIGSIVVPFVKTPSNIAKAIVDFSPAGFAKSITADAYNFKKAVKNGTAPAQMQNKLAKNIGKGMAGVLLYAAGLTLAANGITTGSDDEKDKDIRNYKRNILGINPYSIKIGDQTFTYDWAQPIGSVLSITADLNRNKINMDNAANIIANALATGGNTLFEQSMLSGLSELFGGYDGFIPAIADAVLDMPSQFVPTLSKQIAELTDPYVRRTATGESTDRAVNKVLARIPGASKTLEPVVDVLGRDVKRYGGKNNLFNVFLNPANVNIANPTKETEEIWRLYEETGDAGVFPKTAPTSFTYDGTSYSLTAKEQTQFQRVMGQETETGLQELFSEKVYGNPKSSKQYRKSTAKDKADKTDEQVRADLVKDIIDEAYETAKKDMLKRRGIVVKDKK